MIRNYDYNRTYQAIGQLIRNKPLNYVPLENADIEKFDNLLCAENRAALEMITSPERYEREGAAGIHSRLVGFQQKTCRHYRFLVQRTQGGPYISYIDWMLPTPHRHQQTLELGYFVLPSCRRQGVATEMLQDAIATLPRLRTMLGVQKIILEVGETNQASLELALKLGFHKVEKLVSMHPPSDDGENYVNLAYSAQRGRL